MDLKTYFQTNSQVEFARKIGVTPGAVNQWSNGQSAVAAERCPLIEQATGGLVRCEDLRPDVAWSVLRNTPELAVAPVIPAQAATNSVAVEAAPVDALRAGRIRRLAERRAQSQRAQDDRRTKSGPPFQVNVMGVA